MYLIIYGLYCNILTVCSSNSSSITNTNITNTNTTIIVHSNNSSSKYYLQYKNSTMAM